MAKRRKAAWLALGALALVVASVPAAAQDLDESLDEEARAIFQAGRTAYDAARYEDALRHFQHAYRLSTRPELLYNVALAADRLRRDEEALDAFEKYLDSVPDTPHRAQVEERIRFLRASLARGGPADPPETPAEPENPFGPGTEPTTEEAGLPEPPPLAEPSASPSSSAPSTASESATSSSTTSSNAPPSSEPGEGRVVTPRSPALGIALAAGGGALALGGVGLVVHGLALGEDVEETNAIDWREVEDDADAAPRRYHAGWVLVGAGIAAGVSGLLYLLLRGEERSVALDVGPGHLQLRGRF
ncbi:MAG TPA: tetratricopeptide repeat protein [Polyangiaceae bacterium LLY-WYZ-15_(1-7)]|nr:hypothetical protein [Sandaracinus sp.]HJK90869.1 tetratricopeptide repeat protein [Polyangiaceae bacterium LLY-WYZ-15_(1-7)]HJK99944.1 tetratricopeptide repeat protein [Polyangiaceae bacterium LLY-WYZ-15_(1-7)]HJL11470.1 tetratricopeptide repeat protein [Polyangiaceae bacterium LLY-WYZ-15_(1-7)]HJL21509.1 tetratricopeptide repeat protein [Polyangiaceae bacterium LLY-WYZ-15_(1-7)]